MLLQTVVTVNRKRAKALVDTSLTTTLVMTGFANSWSGASNIRVLDGREVKCCGETDAKIVIRNIPLWLIVLDKFITGIDVILGLDAIDWLGGATIAKCQVKFGNQYVSKMARGVNSNDTIQLIKPRLCQIEDEYFQAHFECDKYTVEWWWTAGPPVLTNQVACYESTLRGDKSGVQEGSWEVDWQKDSNTMVREDWRNTAIHGSGSTYKEKS